MSRRMKTAVILLAHGTKEREASEPVYQYAQALSQQTGMMVLPCLREFIEPSIPTVVRQLVEQGVERIFVLPLFLFKSGHVTRDIARDVAAEKEKYPRLVFEVGEALGFEPALTDVLRKRLEDLKKKPSRM